MYSAEFIVKEDWIIWFKSPLVAILSTDRIAVKVPILIEIFRCIELTVVIALVRSVVKASIALGEDSKLCERELRRVSMPVASVKIL